MTTLKTRSGLSINFNKANKNWSDVYEYNLITIRSAEIYANDLLIARGHVFLNEVFDLLGVQRTQSGQCYGWTFTPDGTAEILFEIEQIGKDEICIWVKVQGDILNVLPLR